MNKRISVLRKAIALAVSVLLITMSLPLNAFALGQTHTVTFIKYRPTNEVYTQVEVQDGDTLTKPADPEMSGYTFYYWQYNDAEYDFDTPVTGNMTLYAVWIDGVIPKIPYIDENGIQQDCPTYFYKTLQSSSSEQIISNAYSWYIVDGNVTISNYISVSGTANIILCDGSTLTVTKGIIAGQNANLNIYAQSAGTGTLNSNTSRVNYPGIGWSSGNITINGGVINAYGGNESAGIGNSSRGSGVNVTINGGTVTAVGGSSAAGIGGSYYGSSGAITINGGTVNATGGSNGTGIGGGYYSPSCGDISINGGNVTATGGNGCAGIGAGFNKHIAKVRLNWKNTTDSIYASSYNATDYDIDDDLYVENTTEFAKPQNISGKTVKPYTSGYYYAYLLDTDGQTQVADPIKFIPGTTPSAPDTVFNSGKRADNWKLNGNNYYFNVVPSGDINLTAVWETLTPVEYSDSDMSRLYCNEYKTVTSNAGYVTWTSGWYYVGSDVTIGGRINVKGDVHLIIGNDSGDCTLTASKGITVNEGNSLTIYSHHQSWGYLVTGTPDTYYAGIGSFAFSTSEGYNCGNITINGCHITARGGQYSAAIGSGAVGKADNVVINWAWGLDLTGGIYGAGLGSGYNGNVENIYIRNLTDATIRGGNNAAGIGTGYMGKCESINIECADNLTVYGGKNSAAIGSGQGGDCSSIYIEYADLTATGGSNAAAIGGGAMTGSNTGGRGGNIIIEGYDIQAIAGTNGYGVGSGFGRNGTDSTLTLESFDSDDVLYFDSINVSSVNFISDYKIEGTNIIVDEDNIAGHTIVPCEDNTNTVSFLDEDGVTPLYTPRKAISGGTVSKPNNPVKDGKRFIEWRLNGSAFDFSTPVNTDISLTAYFTDITPVTYRDTDGTFKTVSDYKVLETTNRSLNLSDNWYVVFGDVNINTRITVNGTVNLLICDGASLNATKGITVNNGKTLNIYGQSNDSGVLTATADVTNYAGIGGAGDRSCGIINISGATVNATGAENGAGIGSGTGTVGGTVRIYGGNVNATGGQYAAAIGSGNTGASGQITIYGGTVNAIAGSGAAGIGAGYSGGAGTITISGGTVTATGSMYSACIGGSYAGSGGTINILGGNVTAVNISSNGVGIGAGYNSTSGGSINLSWTASTDSITASSYKVNVNNLTLSKNFRIQGTYKIAEKDNIDGETLLAYSGDIYTVRFTDSDGTTVISKSQRIVSGGKAEKPEDPYISGKRFIEWRLADASYNFNNIVNQNITLKAYTEDLPEIYYIDADGSEIRTSDYFIVEYGTTNNNFSGGVYFISDNVTFSERIQISGNVSIVLKDGVTLTAQSGISVKTPDTLTVYAQSFGTGSLNATAILNNAAIGGNSDNVATGTIIINGGIINATGASYAAGIGAGSSSASGTVIINRGVVNATGGQYAAAIGGAGTSNSDAGTIIINGGTVNATGDSMSTGIGGGYRGTSGNITINGGVITASGNSSAAGIGSGCYCSTNSGVITINGGTVDATGGYRSAAIGGSISSSGGTININGGNVTARERSVQNSDSTGIGSGYGNSNVTINLNWTKLSDSITSDSYRGNISFVKEFAIEGSRTLVTASNASGNTIVPFPYGDLNDDGDVDLYDYAILKLHVEGTALTAQQEYEADLDRDGAIDAFDLFFLNKRANHII